MIEDAALAQSRCLNLQKELERTQGDADARCQGMAAEITKQTMELDEAEEQLASSKRQVSTMENALTRERDEVQRAVAHARKAGTAADDARAALRTERAERAGLARELADANARAAAVAQSPSRSHGPSPSKSQEVRAHTHTHNTSPLPTHFYIRCTSSHLFHPDASFELAARSNVLLNNFHRLSSSLKTPTVGCVRCEVWGMWGVWGGVLGFNRLSSSMDVPGV